MQCVREGKGPFVPKIDAARAWLVEQAGLTPEHIGIIGFCMGGGFALALGNRFASVSTNDGEIPPDDLLNGLPPTIGCYGGRDKLFGTMGAKLQQKLDGSGVELEVHVFPEVGRRPSRRSRQAASNLETWMEVLPTVTR
jgi:carboxymethylenebutenolidase